MSQSLGMQPILPTAQQIEQTQQAIAAYVQQIATHPDRRDGAYPYALLHPPGHPIRGTVMIFHGFSAKPHQMWRLADYLHRNDFNVYQPSIAGHVYIHPDKNWPQVDLRPEISQPLKEKIQADPVLQTLLHNLSQSSGQAHLGVLQQTAIMARLLLLEPRILDIMQAIDNPADPDFDTYFISSHLNYLADAKARLLDLAAMPGPIYTVGLSVGGAVALALAAAHPERIQRVVVYAPLLKIHDEDRRRYVNLAGPLDISELGWDPNLRFPVGAFTAADRFGMSVVMTRPVLEILEKVPTCLVLTDNEDAADINTNLTFFQAIGAERNGHRFYRYPATDLVPHPMVDPTEISQGMSNHFWKSLYQETFRFLAIGTIDPTNFSSLAENTDLPPVPPL